MRRVRIEVALLVVLLVAGGGLLGIRPFLESAPKTPATTGASAFCPGVRQERPSVGIEPDSSIFAIAQAVQDIRDLDFEHLPQPTYLPPAGVAARAREIKGPPQEAIDADRRILLALGAIPGGFDLQQAFESTEGIAGFYEPVSGELVVNSRQAGRAQLTGTERIVLVHELTHALTDQVLGLSDLRTIDPGTEDRFAARLSLFEGDATLASGLYAGHSLSLSEKLLTAVEAIPFAVVGAGAPHYLSRAVSFPYIEGARFVCDLYGDGGWTAVNRAYDELPTTTAQILFPERYRSNEEALDPPDPIDPPFWDFEGQRSFGAADLLFLFEAPGGTVFRGLGDPLGRAAGWAGGEIRLWTRGEQSAIAIGLIQRSGERSLCASMTAWYRAAFSGAVVPTPLEGEALASLGDQQAASIRCSHDHVLVGIAPGISTARLLAM